MSYDRLNAFYQTLFTTSNTDMFTINNIPHSEVVDFFKCWAKATKNNNKFEEQLFTLPLTSYHKEFFDFYKPHLTELFD
jgi:Zn-dependent M16 (insulinase) family peptidase